MNKEEYIKEYIKPEIEEIKLVEVDYFLCESSYDSGDGPDPFGSVWNRNE